MSRYIDKEELLQSLERKIKADDERGMAVVDSDFIDLVNDATVMYDVDEVVLCKDCKWWDKYDDSLQGRCALLKISPTGGWYCANGRKE